MIRYPESDQCDVLRIILQKMLGYYDKQGACGSENFLEDLLLLDIEGLGGSKEQNPHNIVADVIKQFSEMKLNLLNLLKHIKKVSNLVSGDLA